MNNAVKFETLLDPADARLADLVAIYIQLFPQSERKPNSCFVEMISRPDYAVIAAMLSKTVVGFATVFIPADLQDAALLEYVAVDPTTSGKGIGALLVKCAAKLADQRTLLLEVESASDPQADRRRLFYRRLGARRVQNFQYWLPLPGAPPMDLFVIQSAGPITKHQLHRWLTVIYTKVYGCPADDARLIAMLRELPESIELA